jgi:hypothetical protein
VVALSLNTTLRLTLKRRLDVTVTWDARVTARSGEGWCWRGVD